LRIGLPPGGREAGDRHAPFDRAVVARELGVRETLLGRWVGVEHSRMDVVPAAFDADERAELERLRVENAELR
jgi:transposase